MGHRNATRLRLLAIGVLALPIGLHARQASAQDNAAASQAISAPSPSAASGPPALAVTARQSAIGVLAAGPQAARAQAPKAGPLTTSAAAGAQGIAGGDSQPGPTSGSTAAPAPAPAPGSTGAPARPAPSVKARILASAFLDSAVSGDAPDTLRHSGKIDGYFDISGRAVGVDDGWSLHVHPEFKYGDSANGEVGLLPSNTLEFYPDEGDVFDLSVNLTRRWKSGASLTVGKVNVLDLAAQLPVVGGGGHEGFMNLAMALPPSAIIPGSITGALLNVPTSKALYRLWVFDPQSQSNRSGFNDLFDKGVAFLGSVTVPTRIGGKRGYYALKLAGSTRSEIAAESLPAVLVPTPGSGFGDGKGEFSAVLAAYQFIEEYAEAPGKGWGLFGQVYASAGDPTFLDRSAFFGLSGNPRGRVQDRFGVAWFRYSLTDRLVRTLAARIPLEDEEGVEAFYTIGLNRQLRLTGDVQVVDSAIVPRKRGVILALRLTAQLAPLR